MEDYYGSVSESQQNSSHPQPAQSPHGRQLVWCQRDHTPLSQSVSLGDINTAARMRVLAKEGLREVLLDQDYPEFRQLLVHSLPVFKTSKPYRYSRTWRWSEHHGGDTMYFTGRDIHGGGWISWSDSGSLRHGSIGWGKQCQGDKNMGSKDE